jgi:hypothetical protein
LWLQIEQEELDKKGLCRKCKVKPRLEPFTPVHKETGKPFSDNGKPVVWKKLTTCKDCFEWGDFKNFYCHPDDR